MIITVFRSRLRTDLSTTDLEAYQSEVEAVERHAELAPGFLSSRTYVGEDGERLTVVRFASREAQQEWARDPVHLEAQVRAKQRYYACFEIGVYAGGRERRWARQA